VGRGGGLPKSSADENDADDDFVRVNSLLKSFFLSVPACCCLSSDQ
jgi:hypothetical protein